MNELAKIDELRREDHKDNEKMQLQVKYLHDKKDVPRKFKVGCMVLMWNAKLGDKGKHGKFDPLWLGPYLVTNINGEDS